MIEYDITPQTKPRMTARDKWKKRPAVLRYFAFRDECRLKRVSVPESNYHITFVIPMPQSWAESKKKRMDGSPHQTTPDKDNLEKALLDAVYTDDKSVWDGRVTKLWGLTGKIIITDIEAA